MTDHDLDDLLSRLYDALLESAREYRCQYQQTEGGDGYPLLDALTPDGWGVNKGREEIELLVDAGCDAMRPLLAPLVEERDRLREEIEAAKHSRDKALALVEQEQQERHAIAADRDRLLRAVGLSIHDEEVAAGTWQSCYDLTDADIAAALDAGGGSEE